MDPPRLLLVEDDPVSRQFLVEALSDLPARVDSTQTVAEAEATASRHDHVLWLLDANLPDGNGESLLQRLRKRADTKALALTADSDTARRDRLLAAGFAAVLHKPLSAKALRAAVRARIDGAAEVAVWDPAQALRATGGRQDFADRLRGLFLAELPAQRQQVLAALAGGNLAAAAEQLHRLKAACGFVGAGRLLAAVCALSDDLEDEALRRRFDLACGRQLDACGELD